ncbi:MAG: acyl carrier protein [Pseudonocardia sp.]
MDQRDVEDVLIELLAHEQHRTAAELRALLEERGADLPISSLLTVEIVVGVQDRFGIRLPTTGADHYLRSVREFATTVRTLALAEPDTERTRGA